MNNRSLKKIPKGDQGGSAGYVGQGPRDLVGWPQEQVHLSLCCQGISVTWMIVFLVSFMLTLSICYFKTNIKIPPVMKISNIAQLT